ncbi:MAG: T9SS type A sorting domain-containing protein, partial [Ignavibacteriales bacterium]|nr:T9SS type A sorting domain-containing protein [Ignavibacteriales bacterium]
VGPGNWLIPLTVAETGPERQTIYFGVNPYATSGIDPSQGEYELPPVQMGFFDARFISPYIGEGLFVDYHKFSSYSQVDTFRFMYQPGMGSYPMKISWPQSFVKIACDSMVIADRLVAPTIRARMDIDSTFTVNNFTINSLYIVSYGAFPVPVDVKPITPDVPRGFVLYQNFPNPFNPTTKINFSTDQTAHITLTIYDVLGQEVVMLANTSFFPGVYTLEWNGKNVQGIPMPSGVYYIRMIASNTVDGKASSNPFISTRKMLMMK